MAMAAATMAATSPVAAPTVTHRQQRTLWRPLYIVVTSPLRTTSPSNPSLPFLAFLGVVGLRRSFGIGVTYVWV